VATAAKDRQPSKTPVLDGSITITGLRRLRDALRRLLAEILASPKGDQGGWDGGARGF
jgi:hypothetical protein